MNDKAATSPLAQGHPVARAGSPARTRQATLDAFQDADGVQRPILRPLKAIREKCLDCVCGNRAEVRRCQIYDCSLWPWRMGRRPRPEDLEAHP